MPLYASFCPECGVRAETFCHVPEDRGCVTPLCRCGSTMAPVLSVGSGLTWFRENGARVITNLGHEPVTVRSHEEHKRLLRERGLEWATKWPTQGTGGWV